MSTRIWFITGISRGFGKELARAVLAQGDIVIGTSRSGQVDLDASADALTVLPLEVTDSQQVGITVSQAWQRHGRIDVVVNNAGYGMLGAVEEVSEQQAREVFDVNFFGALNVIRAVLPLLRARRSGHIVNLSSMVGIAPNAGLGLYAASKFALEGLSLSLAQELAPLGIKVTLVEPGSFRTDFLSTQSIRFAGPRIADYADTAGVVLDRLAGFSGRQPGDPVRAALAIVAAVGSATPPLQLVLGSDAMRRVAERQQRFGEDLERWRAISLGTDF